MDGIEMNDIPRINPNISSRILGCEAFIMNLDTTGTYSLNETACDVWKLIDGVRTVEDIAAAIIEDYDVPADVCESSVMGILDRFRRERLIDVEKPHER